MLLDTAEGKLAEALKETDALLAAFRGGEYGKWKGFYQGDLFVNVRYTAELLRWAMTPKGPAPVQPDGYKVIKAYQGDWRTKVN